MQKRALECATLRRAARSTVENRAPHEGEFFLHLIEHPIALFSDTSRQLFLPE